MLASAPPAVLEGRAEPRLAPPMPVNSLIGEWQREALALGIEAMPWQRVAARYMTAIRPDGRWLYRRVAIIVGRQNGKTELYKPRIMLGLRMGRKMLHTAQDRARPRKTFEQIADWFADDRSRYTMYGVKQRGGIRSANGQEEIRCRNGGSYTLVAPRGGARGGSVDDVLLDEVREYHDFTIDGIIRPTTTASRNPQVLYLSNAGDDESVVLNDLRRRKDSLPSLAYLEWSAEPGRAPDDREGWAEANPALGITIDEETLLDDYQSMSPQVFETEHLCRWVVSMQPHLVADGAWERSRGEVEPPKRPVMGLSMDSSGRRASAVIAWQQPDGSIGIRVEADVHGDPIDTDRLGPELAQRALRLGVTKVAYDDWTDKDLARYFTKTGENVNGRDYANASENFVRVIGSHRLRWSDAEQVAGDLDWTARKSSGENAWMAVKAKDDRPITAVLAAIRAVWLASGPKPAAPRIF